MPSRTSILAGLIAGAAVTLLPGISSPLQTGASAAPREVYTRKRVNGRWITGTFTKSGAVKGRARNRLSTRSRGRAAANARREAPRQEASRDEADALTPPSRPADLVPAISTGSIAKAPRKLERMRPALEAHARLLASQTAAAPTAPPTAPAEPSPAAVPAPRSVTFDFDRGVKTVVFGDGVAMSEPFDPNRMRELASLRPEAR